jgi:hypothetical protein
MALTVRLSPKVFTLDRKHFSLYRPGRRRRFSIIPQ